MRRLFAPFGTLFSILAAGCSADAVQPAPGEIVVSSSSYDSLVSVAPKEIAIACTDPVGLPACDQLHPSAAVMQGPSTIIVHRSTLLRLSEDGGVNRIARPGDGPGELRAPIAIGVDSGNRIVVYDVRRARVVHFTEDTLLEENQLLPPRHMREVVMRGGDLFAFLLPPSATQGDSVSASIVRIRTDEAGAVDTAGAFRDASNAAVGDGGAFRPSLPWEATRIWDACPDGSVVVASTNQWRVSRYRMGASAVAIVSRQHSPKPASSAERESVFTAWIESNPNIPAFREGLKARFPEMPAVPPVLDRIVCEGPETVLVRNYPRASESSARWDRVHHLRGVVASFTLSSDADLVESNGDVGLLLRANADGPGISRVLWR